MAMNKKKGNRGGGRLSAGSLQYLFKLEKQKIALVLINI